MSSEDEENFPNDQQHRFNKPDNFKTVLESGEIPDAAMIHAARKRRQKAREQGNSFTSFFVVFRPTTRNKIIFPHRRFYSNRRQTTRQ